MIQVTKPFLPPKEEYSKYLDSIWEREWLTNNGPLVQELESKLRSYLELDNLWFLGNGTIALQIAIKALELEGEIITTPFSYVATTSSIVWEGCSPIFVDIEPTTLNIDHQKIEEAITERTSAILATHVFGNPCNIDAIKKIAKTHHLKVIYDAAHCFGTKYKGRSVFEYGDISTSSFHATKLFHTIEGGAVFTNDDELHKKMWYLRNFGHDGPEKFNGAGINGKNSEFHAAMGLCNLNHIQEILKTRFNQSLLYSDLLKNDQIKSITIQENSEWNRAYYPVILKSEEIALKVKQALEMQNIFPRRYFYPSLDTLDYVNKSKATFSNSISKRILCLPLFHTLKKTEQEKICSVIIDNVGN